MAAIANASFFLYDRFPGEVHRGSLPTADSDGNIFTNASHHKVSTPKYADGYKVEAVDAVRGPAIFIYLKVGTMEAANGLAALDMMGMEIASNVFTGNITNEDDVAKISLGGPAVMALSTWTTVTDNDKWGWFFCGGRVPITLVSALDSTMTTDGNVAANQGCVLIATGGVCVLGVGHALKTTIGFSTVVDA
jgi:hypothetical protein